nr:MAG TPA: hypothetical protein [Caudoviricetes sp.]
MRLDSEIVPKFQKNQAKTKKVGIFLAFFEKLDKLAASKRGSPKPSPA